MPGSEQDYRELRLKLVEAAKKMKEDGRWLTAAEYPGREKIMRIRLIREMLGSLVQPRRPLRTFYLAAKNRNSAAK